MGRGLEGILKREKKKVVGLNYLSLYLLFFLPFQAAGPLTPLINLSPRQGLQQPSSLAYVIDSLCLRGNKSL